MTAPPPDREALAADPNYKLVRKIERALGNDDWMEGTTLSDEEWATILLALKSATVRAALRAPSPAVVPEVGEEEIARAICRAGGIDPDADWSEPKPGIPETSYVPAWDYSLPEARAVLALFRTRASQAPAKDVVDAPNWSLPWHVDGHGSVWTVYADNDWPVCTCETEAAARAITALSAQVAALQAREAEAREMIRHLADETLDATTRE